MLDIHNVESFDGRDGTEKNNVRKYHRGNYMCNHIQGLEKLCILVYIQQNYLVETLSQYISWLKCNCKKLACLFIIH